MRTFLGSQYCAQPKYVTFSYFEMEYDLQKHSTLFDNDITFKIIPQ